MFMKYLIQIMLWVFVTCFLGCGQSEDSSTDAEEKRVVVYSPHGKEMLSDFAERFEIAHPGVQVHWLDMGSQDVLDRIRSERSNPQADIWWGAPSSLFMNAAEEGLLEPYTPTWSDQVGPSERDSLNRWYGTFLTPEVIAFNSQVLTKETAPQDWDDLLDPKWKDEIVIRYPLASGTMRTIFSTMIWRFYRETGSSDKGYEWLRKLDANTKSYPANPTLMYLQLARQEALVTLWNMPDIELQKQTYDYPFDYVIPESGTPVLVEGLAIVANSKHPKLARKFYEFITTPKSFIIQANRYFRIPTRKDLPKERLPNWITETEIKTLEIDWEVFSEKSTEWMKYWDEKIKGTGKS
ncbi:extracellular solute-binding protein [candidate division KSB1 bacterium]|nr:extracellular solute-binding protein [candidate division KSB1 bacterium]NIR69722.1 extracellular solute-binding protein [candidate division KSB1 bacterium]NIS24342.1 extracellular solute-binding protein [candidate division KSB1 bacterium]NIT71274.1 extracellular solute-binding protein [candidate division KSB1 bacterium]NIU24978.1 extracellular solute-binding protein [candidate division KSB1 bacterium]